MSEFAYNLPSEAVRYLLSVHGPEKHLTENMQLYEFACKCGDVSTPSFSYRGVLYADEVLVHPALPLLLQAARSHFNRPLFTTNAYRTQAHNDRTSGSAENSQHLYGLAADVYIPGIAPEVLASFFRDAMGAGGTGVRGNYVHVTVGHDGGDDRTITGGGYRVFANVFEGPFPGSGIPGTSENPYITPGTIAQDVQQSLAGFGGVGTVVLIGAALGIGYAYFNSTN